MKNLTMLGIQCHSGHFEVRIFYKFRIRNPICKFTQPNGAKFMENNKSYFIYVKLVGKDILLILS